MGNGKIGVAPCGHTGEAIIGTYYKCLVGCDKPKEVDFIILDLPQCTNCGSYNVDEGFKVDPLFYFYNPGSPIVNTRCLSCGKCWTR